MNIVETVNKLPELNANSMLAGGVLLGALTYLWSRIQGILSPVITYYLSKYTTFIEIKDNHPTYYFAAISLSQQLPKKRGRFKMEGKGSTVYGMEVNHDTKKKKNWFLLPGYGLHILKIEKYLCFVRFIRRDLNQKEEGKSYEETITLWFPFGHSGLIDNIIEDGRTIFIEKQKNSSTIKRYIARRDYWDAAGDVKYKNIDNIILPEENKSDILDSFKEFIEDKSWYIEHDLPYKTGFLFYGPPGTGKTSMIGALSYKYKMPIYSIPLTGTSASDEELIQLIRGIEEQSILVFEDIDKISLSNKKSDKEKEGITSSRITLSGLLNALDGLNSGEGFITIMTANNPEIIDDALLRPGRIDKKILFNLPHADCVNKFFQKFYKNKEEAFESISKTISEYGWSMAAVQSYCLQYKVDFKEALKIENVDKFNALLTTDYMRIKDMNLKLDKDIDSLEEALELKIKTSIHPRNLSGKIKSFRHKNIEKIRKKGF